MTWVSPRDDALRCLQRARRAGFGIRGPGKLGSRHLDADGDIRRHGARQRNEVDAALAGKHPFVAGGVHHFFRRRRPLGRAVAQLPIVQLPDRNRGEVAKRTCGAIKVQRIDQHAGIGLPDFGAATRKELVKPCSLLIFHKWLA